MSRIMEIQQVTIIIPTEPEWMAILPDQNGPPPATLGNRSAHKVGVGLIVPKLDMRRPGIPRVFLVLPLDWHRSFGFRKIIRRA